MKTLLSLVTFVAFSTSAFASTITLNCTPTAGTNSFVSASALEFTSATGTGSFGCSDASLGAVTLNSVSVGLFSDYQFGNGSNADPNDNSAGFTFTSSGTWSFASPTAMRLSSGVTLFVIGNANSSADTFTNTTSGGLGGTSYVEPLVDPQSGTLQGVFNIPVSAFVDAGGFTNGLSTARVTVTYNFTPLVTTPEPFSMGLLGAGLISLALLMRRRLPR